MSGTKKKRFDLWFIKQRSNVNDNNDTGTYALKAQRLLYVTRISRFEKMTRNYFVGCDAV
jgi:hypothetical protein